MIQLVTDISWAYPQKYITASICLIDNLGHILNINTGWFVSADKAADDLHMIGWISIAFADLAEHAQIVIGLVSADKTTSYKLLTVLSLNLEMNIWFIFAWKQKTPDLIKPDLTVTEFFRVLCEESV